MTCPRCGAPQGMIGWLCGHNGNEDHDREEDFFWGDWDRRMRKNEGKKNRDEKNTK